MTKTFFTVAAILAIARCNTRPRKKRKISQFIKIKMCLRACLQSFATTIKVHLLQQLRSRSELKRMHYCGHEDIL